MTTSSAIRLHHHCGDAYRADACGTTYSLTPWGGAWHLLADGIDLGLITSIGDGERAVFAHAHAHECTVDEWTFCPVHDAKIGA